VNGRGNREARGGAKGIIYDRGTIKVVVFACFTIVAAVVITGCLSYFITRSAVVEKLKTRDIVYIVESISAKIDGRIERAKETSLILAHDQVIADWVAGGETDERLGGYAKARLNDLATNHDYANSFIVSAITNHYWAEGSKMIQVMTEGTPDSQWFFDALKSGKPIDLNIDFNVGRHDTFVFLNALVGDARQPAAVAGVGLSLEDIAQEFQRYKFSEHSNLWLIDSKGKIQLSDNLGSEGRYLVDYIPAEIFNKIVGDKDNSMAVPKVIEYTDGSGETVDLAYQTTKSTDWKLVFQIPRRESIAVLSGIKLNVAVAGLVSLVLMVFVFWVVSHRIADPLKRALLLTAEMEKQVSDRTRELAEQHQKITDSIDYAKRLQESILPTTAELDSILGDYFIIWRPRDTVGGDLYWARRLDADSSLAAVIDCTGHGVPGAFMAMAANSILSDIVDQGYREPAVIVSELNRRMKATLHRDEQSRLADDGLDIGICRIEKHKRLAYAGAKIPMYIKRGDQVHVVKGDNRSIGYRRSDSEWVFTEHHWEIQAGDMVFLTTDGFVDQNGGAKDYPFGRKRLIQAVGELDARPMCEQREAMLKALADYMGAEPQRDDITMLGLSV
jgi:Serine phosphatase RsbU, regulator of sigma subunit